MRSSAAIAASVAPGDRDGPFRLLTINTGSSSLKAAVYRDGEAVQLELDAEIRRIGLAGGSMHIADAHGATLLDRQVALPDHGSALQALLARLRENRSGEKLDAVGHRIVHGGSEYSESQLITDGLMATLERLIPIDPNHLPQAIDAIEVVRRAYPDTPQVACFDTAFHRHMPRVAQIYALPQRWEAEGVVRYGFHGLSYEYIMYELRTLDRAAAEGRVVIAHLGNGASMAAVHAGRSLDTTMGFTPTGGLVMGTRTGDLDPGVLLYLLQSQGMSADEVNDLVNRRSGLLGVSGISADMHDLLDREGDDPQAALAIDLFCYQARKFLASLAAALGGLDTLIFTAGIGEHSSPIRERICRNLEFLGIQLDPSRNREHAPIISRQGSPVTVRIMHTDEDLMIARHTVRLVQEQGDRHVHV